MYMKCVEMACLAEKLDFRRQVILYIVVKTFMNEKTIYFQN